MYSKKNRFFSFILVFLLLISSLVGCKERDENLDITPEKPLEQEEQIVSYKEYEKISYFYLTGLQIPENWYYEETSNGFALIENKTGTEIDFIIEDYKPLINNVTAESAKQVLTTDKTSFVSFQKTSGNQLFYKYYMNIGGTQHAVCEIQKFNYKYIYVLKLICEERFYDKFYPVFMDVVNSLKMTADIKTIPDGYNGIYHENFKLLTLYPRDWKTSVGDNAYTSKYSQTEISMTFAQTIPNFVGMDKTTYNGVMQKSIPGFSTANFSNQNGVVKAEGYYTNNSVRYILYNTIYNFQNYSLNIIYVSPESEYSSFVSVYQNLSQHLGTQ